MKLIEAVQLAARFLRKEVTPDEIKPKLTDPKMGVSHPRPSALTKACGTTPFAADIIMPGAAEIAVVRSPHMHAVIKSIDWRTFKFPTMKTAFEMEVVVRETPRIRGTLGATGVGEMSMVSTAPAVVNAIKDACGVLITELPATPAKVKSALAAAEKE